MQYKNTKIAAAKKQQQQESLDKIGKNTILELW